MSLRGQSSASNQGRKEALWGFECSQRGGRSGEWEGHERHECDEGRCACPGHCDLEGSAARAADSQKCGSPLGEEARHGGESSGSIHKKSQIFKDQNVERKRVPGTESSGPSAIYDDFLGISVDCGSSRASKGSRSCHQRFGKRMSEQGESPEESGVWRMVTRKEGWFGEGRFWCEGGRATGVREMRGGRP